MKILVVRNDKLGDFVLALPAFAMLKKSLPDAEITALVPEYTAEIANNSKYIDNILLDNLSIFKLSKTMRSFDAVIVLFSSFKIALASFSAQVSLRVAPATKIWQNLFNYRLVQRRSQSKKPEYQYNLDLVRYFLQLTNNKTVESSSPFIKITKQITNIDNRIIVIHPGSGGSANNLSLSQYSDLAKLMYKKTKNIKFIISIGPDENHIVTKIKSSFTALPHEIFISTKGLVKYCEFLNATYLFIGGSTGTLHLAGALNLRTVGFYPNRKSSTSLRWQTLNDSSKRLTFSPPGSSSDMMEINLPEVANNINAMFF